MQEPKKIGKIKLKNPVTVNVAARSAAASGAGGSFKNGVKVEDFANVPIASSSENSKGKKATSGRKPQAKASGLRAPAKNQEVIVVSDSDSSGSAQGPTKDAQSKQTAISNDDDVDDDDEDDDFEEVGIPPTTPHSVASGFTSQANTPRYGTDTAEDEDDDMEEVQIDTANETYDTTDSEEEEAQKPEDKGIQIVIGGLNEEEKARRKVLEARKKPITARDRAIRLEAHKMHVIALLANGRVRNRWCCDQLLQCRLLSLCPNMIHQAFKIPPSQVPDKAKRSRMFFEALQGLTTWWSQSFFEVSDWNLGVRTRTWDEVMEIVDSLPRVAALKDKSPEEREAANAELVKKLGEGGERLRTVKSMMKKVLQQEGGRDTSAQLFVALCRALGLGARLVVSLQAVPWRAEKVTTPAKGKNAARSKGKDKAAAPASVGDGAEEEDEFEEVVVPPVGEPVTPVRGTKRKADGSVTGSGGAASGISTPAEKPIPNPPPRQPLYRLRKPKPQKLGSAKPAKKKKTDLSEQPPVFWAEVFCRSDQKWITVDPIKGTIRKKKDFEPKGDSGPVRMLYVVAFEEDGFAKDVTLRYTRTFGAKTAKLRVPVKKDGEDWWENVMGFLKRPYRLNRDDLEDAELETSQVSEGMPMGMTGFKDHPLYVLERHLKREEVILPKREVGRFKGEPVYRRQHVLSCRTAENWMRIGRQVKHGQEPLKWVKQRAVTLNKRRAQELAAQEGEEPLQQGLYSEAQTQLYTPPPIVDGKIPKNAFGNLDLYVPTMLPLGAIHLPYKGIAKVAKQLKMEYAEACTGFEFKKQRAIPVITGIVVAKGQEDDLLDAYWESAAAAEERALTKKQERAIMRWKRLINGMRVQARLQAEYGDGGGLM